MKPIAKTMIFLKEIFFSLIFICGNTGELCLDIIKSNHVFKLKLNSGCYQQADINGGN